MSRKYKQEVQIHHYKLHRRHPNRSVGGDVAIDVFLVLLGFLFVIPIWYSLVSSLKPLSELFRFPPTLLYARNPTFDNFSDLFVTLSQQWVPFSRYLFNTVFLTVVGTTGHVFIASMAAYVLAKYDFPGGKLFFNIVVTTLMFSGYVTGIPSYIIQCRLHMIDTYWAILIPAFAAQIGMYLMKQFMGQIPMSLLEAARIDGAGEFRIWWSVVMPSVKPAWLTVIIFAFQSIWNNNGNSYIYNESMKVLPSITAQVQAGGIARAGAASAVMLVLMLPPLILFQLTQKQVIETMTTSGIKE